MPFARPSLAELIDRVKSDMRGRLEIDGPLLRRAMADVLATVWAGAVHTLYGYLDWLAKQLFGDTSDAAELVRQAALYGITPVAATFAAGNVSTTGVNTDGTPIPLGTILSLDAVTKYRVTTGQVVAGGVATMPVVAVLAGSTANIPVGTALTLESPIAGVNSAMAVAAGGIVDGNDGEDLSTDAGVKSLRARYIAHLQAPPEGGADQDYIAWARQVAGVTRVWVYENENGLGTVVVRFVLDAQTPSILPDVGPVAAVQAVFAAQRPMCAIPTAVAPTELDVAFTIHLVPDTADTRAAVSAELADLFTRAGAPGDGVLLGKVLLSQIRTAIGTAADVTDYTLTVPAADVVPGVGQLPALGVVTFV